MVVSTFPYLPLSYHVQSQNRSAKALTQSVSTILMYSGGWFYKVVIGALSNFSHGIPGVGMGVHLLLNSVNVTDTAVPDSGMEIPISESYGKSQEILKVWKIYSVWQSLSLQRHT